MRLLTVVCSSSLASDVCCRCHENTFTLEYLSQLSPASSAANGSAAKIELVADETEQMEVDGQPNDNEDEEADEETTTRVSVKKEAASPRLAPASKKPAQIAVKPKQKSKK
jgi:hypothetical protein